jgi:hypothetical protein
MMLPHYDEKTGDPTSDNASRKWNKRLRHAAMRVKLDTPGGRRRKKHVLKIERANYVIMLNETIIRLMDEDAARGSESPFRG